MTRAINQRFLTMCRQLFSSCMLLGVIVGVLTHAGRLPMQSGTALSTYFAFVTTVTFVVLGKKDPEFLSTSSGSTKITLKDTIRLVGGAVLFGIMLLNAMFFVKMFANS